jgi:hypothetical protein
MLSRIADNPLQQLAKAGSIGRKAGCDPVIKPTDQPGMPTRRHNITLRRRLAKAASDQHQIFPAKRSPGAPATAKGAGMAMCAKKPPNLACNNAN